MTAAHRITLSLAATAALALSGCGIQSGPVTATAPATPFSLKGKIMGGRQPISGAQIDVWQAGATGYGMGAANIGTTSTDTNGNFDIGSIISAHSCGTVGSEQLYLTGSGGNPGLSGSGTTVANPDAVLMVALGACENVNPTGMPFININELTTVAAVWSLAPFMANTGVTASNLPGITIGSSATNTAGLASAFSDTSTLVSLATGSAATSTASITVPTTEVSTLGDILADCVNSDPSMGGACSQLFTDTTVNGTAPSNTLQAALNIAMHPSQHASDLLALAVQTAPYQPTLTSINDFTLAVTYTGSGISAPAAVAVDATGNVWIANATNSVTELAHNGAALSGASGYTAGTLSTPSAIAIDSIGNAWVANHGNSTLTELSSSGANVGSSPFSGDGLSSPASLSFDAVGNLWVANAGSSTVSEFSSAGAALGSYTDGSVTSRVGVAVNPQ